VILVPSPKGAKCKNANIPPPIRSIGLEFKRIRGGTVQGLKCRTHQWIYSYFEAFITRHYSKLLQKNHNEHKAVQKVEIAVSLNKLRIRCGFLSPS
jgi:hypothetical protein